MKIHGKEVIEIRPMTRWEYRHKNNMWNTRLGCKDCYGYIDNKYCNGICSEQPAYVNGKFKMIVRVK